MQLSKYISELLLSHECVTVPALGSFISTFKSAYYDLTNEKFYPPSKNISFNSQINKNDGLLAKHISTKEGIDYNLVLKDIHTEVIKITQTLKKEKYSLKEIGELSLSSENKIIFSPYFSKNYLKDSFGLSTLSVKQISSTININYHNFTFIIPFLLVMVMQRGHKKNATTCTPFFSRVFKVSDLNHH